VEIGGEGRRDRLCGRRGLGLLIRSSSKRSSGGQRLGLREVTQFGSGVPVAGVLVRLSGRFEATAGHDGRFVIPHVPAGSHFMGLRRDGYAFPGGPIPESMATGVVGRFGLADQEQANIWLELATTGTISATIRTSGGEPVRSATTNPGAESPRSYSRNRPSSRRPQHQSDESKVGNEHAAPITHEGTLTPSTGMGRRPKLVAAAQMMLAGKTADKPLIKVDPKPFLMVLQMIRLLAMKKT
jgi:hypothetical protein